MQAFLKKIITQTVLQKKRKSLTNLEQFSPFVLAKGFRELKVLIFSQIKDIGLIVIGIFSAAFGFKGFLLTNHFIDGGVTGISLLINAITNIPIHLLIIGINLPFILLGYRIIGKWFAIKTALSITGLALCLAFVEFPDITKDNLLVAIFGGFFLGAGIGLSVRGGAVIDGTEVLAIYLSRKLGTTIGDIIILINVLIFSAAAYWLTFEIAMYSMITYLSASKTLDFIIEGIDEYTGVTIISAHDEDIRQMIITQMGRGVTVYAGKRGIIKEGEKTDINIIYTVITRLELNRLNAEIAKIDANAFVVMSTVNDTKGGMIKKRPLQH
jgi:uncharacterized membrane-anchored protein YitT (DUF2179 family)